MSLIEGAYGKGIQIPEIKRYCQTATFDKKMAIQRSL